MNIKQLIAFLSQYQEDTQVFIASDEEGNEILSIDEAHACDMQKTNNVGSFEAIVLFPNHETHEFYTSYDEE